MSVGSKKTRRTWRIGVTGSIATGKSSLLACLEKAGAAVFSADAAVAELYRGAAVAPIAALFAGTVADGQVDRQELARQLAADPARFAALEAVVHPLVRAEIARFFARAEADGWAVAAVEVPLLFETGHDYGLDVIAVTHVEESIQHERLMARPGMNAAKRDALIARQMPQAEKMARADRLFDMARPLALIEAEAGAWLADLAAPRQEKTIGPGEGR